MAEASDRDLGIQNDFFNQARKSRSRITILLNSGKRLAGRIKSFDRYTLILDAGGGAEEMVFKHAIATISVGSGRPTRRATITPSQQRDPRRARGPTRGRRRRRRHRPGPRSRPRSNRAEARSVTRTVTPARRPAVRPSRG